MKKLYQPFHLVTLSPWPLLLSFNLLILMISLMNLFNNFNYYMLLFSMLLMMLSLYQWWRDVIRESTFQGFHTKKVVLGLKLGMLLFITSEVLFFFSIFWCYFHMFLSPSIEIGSIWPPKNIITFNPYHIPLLNTIILLSSGVTITWCHYSILMKMKMNSFISLALTITLGMIFTFYQYKEYSDSSFTITDSIYGSIFFMSTGFHGIHVIIGTMFLLINLIRIYMDNYSNVHHFGFEAAAWYWHFVDVVWLFLYLLIYFWSS
uniref:Cytochrome c oxidase subunit 3 n=1 Tax=Nasonia vitripennis TaxID=7425 RepID=B5T2Y7_NASVI|nr:cytochrome c oxidase subunit III [Nasonia vitripennis]ACH81732.1 cytochrome oxidase subunit 3 [Nasonia vitripennis]QVT11045.1 cytochrome c oxidase subunit III [Nasonia vitripennis]UVN15288.1 cytochrome oxidase subunit 3 [Nasonia vitripennis]